ncbi:MAG TPA: cell wall-binding repeat-containing protein [Patescibacteria group bacterium]|nr:cell wall-binding repeat-containing protein [Patescibacteria group bacterium]
MTRATHLLLSLLILLSAVPLTGAAAPPPADPIAPEAAGSLAFRVDRLAGTDRFATAAAVSRKFFSPGVPVVYVASGLTFPDGLAAGPAAHRRGGPVLFVHRDWLPAATKAEIQRLAPGRIIVVGGTTAVSDTVRSQLAALAPGGATRIAGPDRYATAAAVVHDAFTSAPVVYIATGEKFPDALSGGAGAAVQGGAVLLVRATSIPAATRAELLRLAPARIVIVGGTSAVSASVASELATYAGTVVRRAGADRYATAASVSQYVFPNGADRAFLATGLNFPDALGAVSAAGRQRAPILLVSGSVIATATGTELQRLTPDRIFLLGGETVVGIDVAKTVQRWFGVCWAGTRPPAGVAQIYTRLADAPNQLALTFDMGGRLVPALEIIRWLVDHQVCATIFPTGATSQTTEGAAVIAALRAHPELFEIGNHTVHHCDLVNGGEGIYCPTTPPTTSFIVSELTGAETILRSAFGQTTKPYWRPPYGAHNAYVRAAAASAGYTKTVMWNIDTIDWDPDTSAAEIVARVVPNATSGSIVLNHLGGYATLDALPTVVSQLRAKGFTLTTLSDMLD